MQSIAESHDPALRALYLARSEKLSTELLAFGASDDHVHLAVRMALTRSIAEVVRVFKSESAVVLARRLGAPNLPLEERLRSIQHRSRKRDAAARLRRTPSRAPSHRILARRMGANRARRRVQRLGPADAEPAPRSAKAGRSSPGRAQIASFHTRLSALVSRRSSPGRVLLFASSMPPIAMCPVVSATWGRRARQPRLKARSHETPEFSTQNRR
ncbi:MAG: transposase [Myxococcales bacterium]|nr:transposase [Myxococcales bacterium]